MSQHYYLSMLKKKTLLDAFIVHPITEWLKETESKKHGTFCWPLCKQSQQKCSLSRTLKDYWNREPVKAHTAACWGWRRERQLRRSQWVWGAWAKAVIKKVRTVTDGPPVDPFHLNALFWFRKSNINSTVRQRLTGTHLRHFPLVRMETSQAPGRRQWCHGHQSIWGQETPPS